MAWSDGASFFLNAVGFVEIHRDDERLTIEERARITEEIGPADGFLELPITDPRSGLTEHMNNGAICLAALNRDPEGLGAVFFSSFDFIDEVAWLVDELDLRRDRGHSVSSGSRESLLWVLRLRPW